MGSTPRAHLAYGYDLGSDEDFKAAERSEYGAPNLPWLPGYVEDAGDEDDDEDGYDDEEDGPEFVEAVEKLLLERIAGFTETDRRAEGYFDRHRAAQRGIGVEVDSSGGDIPGWMLIATGSERSVEWSEAMTLDLYEMGDRRVTDGWDERLAAALAALGITPTQDRPRWLVYPSYG